MEYTNDLVEMIPMNEVNPRNGLVCENERNGDKLRSKKTIKITLLVMGFFILLLIFILIFKKINSSSNQKYNVEQSNVTNHKFPQIGDPKYFINFNITTMQANYVFYISTHGGNGAQPRPSFRNDPYNIDVLTTNDYTGYGYEYNRGHLVPNADYGDDTFYMPNVVPMKAGFNQGVWYSSEKYIQMMYSGYLVYKGCEYDYNEYLPLNNKKFTKLYIPVGCYYVIFNADTFDKLPAELLDYGYYKNIDNSNCIKKLPFWLVPSY